MPSDGRYQGLKVAVVCCTLPSGEVGGAERLFHALLQALLDLGCDARLVLVPGDETTFDHILSNYEYCRNLDLSEFDVVISTKAPTFAIKHPRHVLWLVHTTRVFYDMFERAFPGADRTLRDQRDQIQAMDSELLGRIANRFTIGHQVSQRLEQYNDLTSNVLHPPMGENNFREGEYGDYFFIPGRLHPWKRLDLLIEAVKLSRKPLQLKIAGVGEAEEELKALAAGDDRIEFLGRVSDEQLISLYAGALAVPFVPQREDYGYITIEAFTAAKAVITCHDSGEPGQFVQHGITGLVCDPEPEALRQAMERLYEDRPLARTMGQAGQIIVQSIQWPAVASTLLDSCLDSGESALPASHAEARKTRVTVIDMQPIDPPIGGGRVRLLGLYHDLGPQFETRYVGSYDWEGEQYRRHRLSDSLEEIDIPLSAEHHQAARALAQQCGDRVVIDLAFPAQVHLSPDYLEAAREQIEWADVVVFSHPWAHPALRQYLQPKQLLVYDSQNVESFLRAQILDLDNPAELDIVKGVIESEHRICHQADIVLACSNDDLEIFHRIYDLPPEKIRIAPNGVFAQRVLPPTSEQQAEARRRLGVESEGRYAIFLGSNYGPNVEGAKFIIDTLAPAMDHLTFVIAGGVGAAIQGRDRGDNVLVTGFLEEQDKLDWLHAADMAINPMFSGSGTNIKMFDFMASGLPAITTETGARGIESPGGNAIQIVAATFDGFVKEINKVLGDAEYRQRCGQLARSAVEQGYAWEYISPELGSILDKARSDRLDGSRTFSVIIPSYERPQQLQQLVDCLRRQNYKLFEVIIVDQSAMPWPGASETYPFPLRYIHTDIKGAVRARNTGALYANGQILAFTDDDCRPEVDWLENAVKYFRIDDVVGVEGKIYSDHPNDPDFRPVTNVGFKGFGFMTANLFARHSAFKLSGGFDLQFDQPHFREDTDLGWRLLRLGKIPYGDDVQVFHPAQPRDNSRESLQARAAFFEKDALLYRKHPGKYMELFLAEGHWARDHGFWEHFARGADKYNVDISELESYRKGLAS